MTVVYPSRWAGNPEFRSPPERVNRTITSLRVAYAGADPNPYPPLIPACARVLADFDSELLVYSQSPEKLRAAASECPAIRARDFVVSTSLISRLRDEADVLLVPMSFRSEDRPNMEVAFPSKLADYTAAGLPILIWAPPYCSAVRWARENPGIADVVDHPDPDALRPAFRRLIENAEHRRNLAQAALEWGNIHFAHAAVSRRFMDALRNG